MWRYTTFLLSSGSMQATEIIDSHLRALLARVALQSGDRCQYKVGFEILLKSAWTKTVGNKEQTCEGGGWGRWLRRRCRQISALSVSMDPTGVTMAPMYMENASSPAAVCQQTFFCIHSLFLSFCVSLLLMRTRYDDEFLLKKIIRRIIK